MRISGYGAGFGQQSGAKDRAASFRARHSIGQRITGRIIRREHNGLYWVLAGGEELLARLEVCAEPGDHLVFIVRALTPEIMLQALPKGASAADLPGLVQRFRAAREVFEVQAAKLMAMLSSTPPQARLRQDSFNAALAAHAECAMHFAKAQDILAQVNAALDEQSKALAHYQPWLLPGCRRQEMLRKSASTGVEIILSAATPASGTFEISLKDTSGQVRLSLSAERPEAAGPLLVELTALAREETGTVPETLGPTRLRQSSTGGVLGQLFGEIPAWSSGGLNTRV